MKVPAGPFHTHTFIQKFEAFRQVNPDDKQADFHEAVHKCNKLLGGGLGSTAEEGRDKLRYALARRM